MKRQDFWRTRHLLDLSVPQKMRQICVEFSDALSLISKVFDFHNSLSCWMLKIYKTIIWKSCYIKIDFKVKDN